MPDGDATSVTPHAGFGISSLKGKMMRFNHGLIGLMAMVSAACSNIEPEMDLDRLIHLHTEARGGADAIENVSTLKVNLEIVEPEFTVTGEYVATRDGYMRIDVFSDGARVFTEALGPGGGWQMFGDGTITGLTPEGEAALHRGVFSNLYGLHELRAQGFSFSLAGKEERNGAQYWMLEQIAPDGFSQNLFVDPDTYLVMSDIRTAALHPDLDSTEVNTETFYFDFQETAGVVFSERSEKRNIATGDVMQNTRVTSRVVNDAVDASIFSRPSE